MNLAVVNKVVFDKDKIFSNKIKKIKLALEEINKNGYLEIESGGQEFDKSGSSIRWDGNERIYISDDKKFWDILSNYLSLEFQIEVKLNEIHLSK